MSYILRINRPIKEASILFDVEHDEDLIRHIDDIEYSSIEVNDNSKVLYKVLCDGYEPVSNTIIVDKDYTFDVQLKKKVKLTIVTDPEDATVVITYNGKNYKKKSLTVLSNTPVKYTVSRKNRETVSNIIMLESDQTIEVKLSYRIDTDGEMGRYEGEYSDKVAEINLITQKEYDNLSEKTKKRYVKYNDLLSFLSGVDYNLTLNDCIVQLYWMLPIVHKLTPFTNGTLGHFQADFINMLAQINSLLSAAKNVNGKIKSIRKALKKVKLGKLTDILTTGFGLIGGLAGIVYALMNNPNILIKTYAQAFADIDLNEIYDRTIKETLPNLDYVKGMLNRTYIPEGSLKKNIFDRIEQVDAAADMSLDIINQLAALKQMVDVANSSEEAMQDILEALSTMSLQWAIGSLSGAISKLRLDKDKMKSNYQNNNLNDAYNVMRDNIDKILNDQENYYIDEEDLAYLKEINDPRTSTEKVMDYETGYKDALDNGYNGESEQDMDAKLTKYKREMEELGKDPSSYIYGYKIGWQAGRNMYENEINNITTEEQKDSHSKGYQDGYNFSKVVRDLAYNSLNMGKMEWFIDIDNHIHYLNNYPYGRISGELVYNFNPDGTETVIGTYNPMTFIMTITSTNKNYLVVDNRYIYDTTIKQEITDDNINELIETFYKINLMRVERQPVEGTINPYYAKGWKDGYDDRNIENETISDSIQKDEEANAVGMIYSHGNEPISKITEEIEGYREANPETYEIYAQGLIRGYNTGQSQYNTGYNSGWYNSIKASDYEEGESPEDDKNEYLNDFCNQYGLDRNIQDSLPDNEKDLYYLGAINGWDDMYNEVAEPNWRESYYLDY